MSKIEKFESVRCVSCRCLWCWGEARSYLEEWVVGQVLQGEVPLARVSRVRLPQHGVPVTRYDLTRFECFPDKIFEFLFGGFVADLLAQLLQPHKYLLVGETVKGPR